MEDFSRVLTSYVDAVVFRGKNHQLVEQFARHARCPVINGLTNCSHPCQALGDMLTLWEKWGEFSGKKLAFVGDGNNVAHSLAVACAMLNIQFTMGTPAEYQLRPDFLDRLQRMYPEANLHQTTDPVEAVSGASAVYTDVWASMGQEAELRERRVAMADFRVDDNLMSRAAEDACFLHCLPARRGEEVTDEVMDGSQSVVVQQAENRMHAQKAVLVWLFQHAPRWG